MKNGRNPRNSRPNDDAGFIGDKAEQLVRVDWCRRHNIVTNMAGDEDKCGWDLHLEVPVRPTTPKSVEQQSGPHVTYVQVKGTRASEGPPFRDIRLDHWRTAIHRQSPFFFVFIQFDDEAVATSAYLTHVDEHWIAKGLKAIRAAQAKYGEDVDLSKHTMRLRPRLADALSPPLHFNFFETLVDTIGQSEREYAEKKRTLVENIGFDKLRVRGTLSISKTRSDDQLTKEITDWTLGRQRTLVLDGLTADEVRFDIAIPVISRTEGQRAVLCFDPGYSGAPVSLVARVPGFAPSLPMAAKLRTNVNPLIDIPADKRAFRITSTFIDITIEGSESTLEIKLPDWQELVSAEVLAAEAAFLTMLSKGCVTLEIQQEGAKYQLETRVTLDMDPVLEEALTSAAWMQTILAYFQLPSFPLSLQQAHRSRGRIALLSAVAGAPRRAIPRKDDGVQIRIAQPQVNGVSVETHSIAGRTCGKPFVVALPMQSEVLIVWIAAVGQADALGTETVINLDAREFDRWIGPPEEVTRQLLTDGLRRVTEELEAQMPDIFIIEVDETDDARHSEAA